MTMAVDELLEVGESLGEHGLTDFPFDPELLERCDLLRCKLVRFPVCASLDQPPAELVGVGVAVAGRWPCMPMHRPVGPEAVQAGRKVSVNGSHSRPSSLSWSMGAWSSVPA